MNDEAKVVLSARLSTRSKQLAKAAAELRGVTLSRFVAEAVEEAARSELVGEESPTRRGNSDTSPPHESGPW